MSLYLSAKFSGIDALGHEVNLHPIRQADLVDPLINYARNHMRTLWLGSDVFLDGKLGPANLLIYYYFVPLNTPPDRVVFESGMHPCVALQPEEVGLTRAQVLVVLNELKPYEVNTQRNAH